MRGLVISLVIFDALDSGDPQIEFIYMGILARLRRT